MLSLIHTLAAKDRTMNFWAYNAIFMLGTVCYAASISQIEPVAARNQMGLSSKSVGVAEVATAALAADYGLGFGEADPLPTPTPGEASDKDGEDASEGASTDAVAEKDAPKDQLPAKSNEQPTYLIYFTATWCGPCRAQRPVIEAIQAEGKVKTYIVDVDNDKKTAASWRVSTVPTVATVREGKVTYRGVGTGHTRDFLLGKLESK